MSTFLSVLAALLLLSILVMVHELGHFWAGRKLGFSIMEFAIGMGPVLVKKERKGILYTLRALPIGGMCKFYGEDQPEDDAKSFHRFPAWKRILVIVAGPVMNLLFALVFSIVALTAYGNYMPSVLEVTGADAPAAVAGIRPGDIIAKIDGKTVHEYADAVPMIKGVEGDTMIVTVQRDGQTVDCELTNFYNAEAGYNVIGVTIEAVRVHYGFFRSVGDSFHYIGSVIGQIFDFFGTLFQGKVSASDVAGPVGTIAYVSQAVRYGLEMILRFAVLISISLGVFNLLPIPALDGGRLAFLIVEAVTGKRVNPEREGMIHFVGLILLFGLILFLTYNDIANLIRN